MTKDKGLVLLDPALLVGVLQELSSPSQGGKTMADPSSNSSRLRIQELWKFLAMWKSLRAMAIPAQEFTYRKARNDIFWQFYDDCKRWPIRAYDQIRTIHPPIGGFCTECVHKRIIQIQNHFRSAFLRK